MRLTIPSNVETACRCQLFDLLSQDQSVTQKKNECRLSKKVNCSINCLDEIPLSVIRSSLGDQSRKKGIHNQQRGFSINCLDELPLKFVLHFINLSTLYCGKLCPPYLGKATAVAFICEFFPVKNVVQTHCQYAHVTPVSISTQKNIHVTHVKDLAVHVRVRQITETRKDPACTLLTEG